MGNDRTVAPNSSFEEWERIRGEREPDPLVVLGAVAGYKRYFEAVEHEAITVARKLGRTWEEIAQALGQSRQAVWQRAARDPSLRLHLNDLVSARWRALKADPHRWYRNTRPYLHD